MAIKKITIRDVAREAGVSVTLVSFVMNAKVRPDGRLDCPVNPNTAARVLETAKRLGYRRNNAAASLRSGHSHTIAMIISDISSPFFSDICRHVENLAYKAGYTVLFASSDESSSKLGSLIDTVIGYNVEGLIVAPSAGSENMFTKAVAYNIPTVLIDRDIPGDSFGRVLVNNVESGYVATKYLIEQGRRNIEMLSYGIGITSLSERAKGYSDKMKEAGLDDNINIHTIDYDASEKEVISIVKDAYWRGVDAFVLPTKRISMYVLNAIMVLGLNVPKDLSLVCFDESDVYEFQRPVIPHMVQPRKEIAEQSFAMLQRMIEGKKHEDIRLNSKLVLDGTFSS